MRFTFLFTAALTASALANPLPSTRSRGRTDVASNEVGVVELKTHGPVDKVLKPHGILPQQGHPLVVRHDIEAFKKPKECTMTDKTIFPWGCMDGVECGNVWKKTFFPWGCRELWEKNKGDH